MRVRVLVPWRALELGVEVENGGEVVEVADELGAALVEAKAAEATKDAVGLWIDPPDDYSAWTPAAVYRRAAEWGVKGLDRMGLQQVIAALKRTDSEVTHEP